MIYPDNFSPDIHTCEFTIERLFVYNPALEPKMLKPAESDYQDAKLLFYHPADAHIEIKRNDVGLMEAMVTLWNSFGGKGENPTDHQLLYTDQYSYIIHHIENDFWICFVVKNMTKEATYYSIDEKTYNYIASDTFKIEKPILTENLTKKFGQHFVLYFELFHGRVESFFQKEDERLAPEFSAFMERYILNYKKLNCLNFPRINATKYLDKNLNYAPIDKKVFMSVHFLLDVIKNIDLNIKHHMVFYNGYFIYSTLENKLVQTFYDYFYTSGDTLCIEANKMFTKFVALAQPGSDSSMKYGARLPFKNNRGYLMGYPDNAQSKNKIMMESIEDNSEIKKKSDDESFIPTIYLDRFEEKKPHKLVTYFDTGLLLLLFYDTNTEVEMGKLSEIQSAVTQNIPKLSESLDKQIKRIYVQEDISKLIYENQCNFAFRMSRMYLKSIEIHPSKMISYMKDTFDSDPKCRGIISRCYGTWIYSRISNQRRVFLLLNSSNNLAKTEEEKEKLLEYNFSNILY